VLLAQWKTTIAQARESGATAQSWLWAPAAAARIGEPTRTIEVACFLRYCLMVSTDHLLW
jgi:hypothetical protein